MFVPARRTRQSKYSLKDMVEGEVVGEREGVDQLGPKGEKCSEETGTNTYYLKTIGIKW